MLHVRSYTPNKYKLADKFYNQAKNNRKNITIIIDTKNNKVNKNNLTYYKKEYLKLYHELIAEHETNAVKKNGELNTTIKKIKKDTPNDFDFNYKW